MFDVTKLIILSPFLFRCVLACGIYQKEMPCAPMVNLSWIGNSTLSSAEKERIVYFIDEVLYVDKEKHGSAIFEKYITQDKKRNQVKFPYDTKLQPHNLLLIDKFRHHGGKFISSLYRCVTPNVDNVFLMRVCIRYFIEDHVRHVDLDQHDIQHVRDGSISYFKSHMNATVFDKTTEMAWIKIFDIFTYIVKSPHDIWLKHIQVTPINCHIGYKEDYIPMNSPNPCDELFGPWKEKFKPTYGEIYIPDYCEECNATNKSPLF